ncbi:hypothetical protein [Serinicoccus sp. LYQ131]|uniref:hypothetical protein n=1 Tax=Serinicoccus sp. LYQ131 TaxID=3378797 RepID=UPI0038521DCE
MLFVLGLTLLGAGVGAAVGSGNHAYETRVVVGTRDLTAQQVPYYSTATVSLAETYARYVTEEEGADLSPDVTVTASVIADSPVIRILATSSVEADAERAAEQTAENLIAEVNEGTTGRVADLSQEIVDLSREIDDLNLSVDELDAQDDREQLLGLNTEVRLAELELAALSDAYREAQAEALNPATQLSLVQPSYPVTETVPRPTLVGAVAGALISGLAILGWITLRTRQPTAE